MFKLFSIIPVFAISNDMVSLTMKMLLRQNLLGLRLVPSQDSGCLQRRNYMLAAP